MLVILWCEAIAMCIRVPCVETGERRKSIRAILALGIVVTREETSFWRRRGVGVTYG
jgi:hypothetical protein